MLDTAGVVGFTAFAGWVYVLRSVLLRLLFILVTVVVKTHLNNVNLKMLNNLKLTVLAFMFNLRPASPPVSMVLVVITIVTTTDYVRTTNKLSLVIG